MESRFLESLVAVVDGGSIAEAARRLSLTPAGVAQRIHAIEAEIGSQLVVRSGRTMKLTEAGVAVIDHIRELLEHVRDLRVIAANEQPIGELRVGAFHTASSGLLPDILRRLTKTYPSIEVHIERGTSAELYQMLSAERIDVAIIAQPPFAIPKALEWRNLRNEPLIVLAPRSASASNAHALLSSDPYIALDHKNWAGRLADSYLRQARIRPRQRYELSGLEPIAVMVDRGLGVSVVPDWAPPWPEGLSLAKLALPKNPFARRVGLLWNRTSIRVRLVDAFLEVALIELHGGNPLGKKHKRRGTAA
jgi:DNA-binding transcriptional LysR family regulator